MAGVLRKLRNNWKKTIFFGIVGYAGADYGSERFRIQSIMRELSLEAESYGKGPLPPGARNKHITVLLNPASGNRKARDKFEKFAEPLLHLAGFLVNVVKTEKISEARELVEIVEKTNIIVVGGGDGTLMEVVTGLLRREDAEEAVRRFSVGVIPLGRQNSFATSSLDYDPSSPKRSIAESAIRVGRHCIQPKDVIKVELIPPLPLTNLDTKIQLDEQGEQEVPNTSDETEEQAPKKPYYLMTGFKLGDFCEAERREAEMPGFLYSKFCRFWSLLRTPSVKSKVEIRYRPYCSGCSNCKSLWVKYEDKETSLLGRIISVFRPAVYAAANEDSKWSRVNNRCGVWDSICVDSSELNVQAKGDGKLEIQVGKNLSRTDFIREGLRRRYNDEADFGQRISCQEVEIFPVTTPSSFYMDNEDFPAKPIRMEVLRNKVNFFRIPAS